MESNSTFQPNEVPNSQVNPSPRPACFHPHPLHQFHQYHYHWVSPPFLCGHAPIPICPCGSPKTNESLPAHYLPKGTPAQSNATNTVSAQQETHNNDTSNVSMGCQAPGVPSPCLLHATPCPHHYWLPCRAHGYWRPPCPPMPCCPLPHMLSSCPANTACGEPHLNTVEAFLGPAEGEPTTSHIGAEIWHREGEIQANQDGATEEAYELEEEEEEEEEEPIFVLTDEWMEFFAKSEARRQQKKKQQQKEAKKLRKAARSAPKKHDGEVEILDSAEYASADASSSALS